MQMMRTVGMEIMEMMRRAGMETVRTVVMKMMRTVWKRQKGRMALWEAEDFLGSGAVGL